MKQLPLDFWLWTTVIGTALTIFLFVMWWLGFV